MSLLEVSNLRASYGKALAIESVSIKVEKGELIGVLGPNGAGKTTLLKAISRSIPSQGTLMFKGQSLDGVAPYDVVARGICHCPEGRKLFSELSVLKNLQLGAYLRKNKAEIDADLERVFTLFPGSARTAMAAVQHAVRRRTADGGDRPRTDGASGAAAARRAVSGHRAAAEGPDLRCHPADQEGRHGHPDRRTGRHIDLADHRSCLRA